MAKFLAIDYGSKRIGLAVSDQTGLISKALKSIDLKDEKSLYKTLDNVIRDNSVDEVVVGLPKNMNGTIGHRADNTMMFVEKLKARVSIPVNLWDERLTTREAEKVLIRADISRRKRKKVIDGMAAQLILQGFLDWKNRK